MTAALEKKWAKLEVDPRDARLFQTAVVTIGRSSIVEGEIQTITLKGILIRTATKELHVVKWQNV